MSDRLTKEREAEIRQQVERWRPVPFTSPTVKEWCHMANAAHDWPGDDPRSHEDREEISREIEDESLDGLRAMLCDALRLATKHRAELLAELDALRAAPPTTYLHADGTEEPIGELVERLTRERDEALASAEMWSDNAKASTIDLSRAMARAEKAEANLIETRAQLAALRDAAEGLLGLFDADSDGDPARADVDSGLADLRAALSTTGPTLAEIRRAAQVEVLREMQKQVAALRCVTCYHAIDAASVIRKRADDLEAGR